MIDEVKPVGLFWPNPRHLDLLTRAISKGHFVIVKSTCKIRLGQVGRDLLIRSGSAAFTEQVVLLFDRYRNVRRKKPLALPHLVSRELEHHCELDSSRQQILHLGRPLLLVDFLIEILGSEQ
jgi:hypothetical protein